MLLQETILDGNWMRFVLLVTSPFTFCVSIVSTSQSPNSTHTHRTFQFFCNQIISNVGMMWVGSI